MTDPITPEPLDGHEDDVTPADRVDPDEFPPADDDSDDGDG